MLQLFAQVSKRGGFMLRQVLKNRSGLCKIPGEDLHRCEGVPGGEGARRNKGLWACVD